MTNSKPENTTDVFPPVAEREADITEQCFKIMGTARALMAEIDELPTNPAYYPGYLETLVRATAELVDATSKQIGQIKEDAWNHLYSNR